jgi:hypothetical protein
MARSKNGLLGFIRGLKRPKKAKLPGRFSTYSLKTIPGLESVVFQVIRVDPRKLALKLMSRILQVVPMDAIEGADEAAIQKLMVQAQEDPGFLDTACAKSAAFLIEVIDDGIPEWRGRIHATLESIPKLSDGTMDPHHFYYEELGEDLFGMFEAVVSHAGLGKERVDQTRTFPERQHALGEVYG